MFVVLNDKKKKPPVTPHARQLIPANEKEMLSLREATTKKPPIGSAQGKFVAAVKKIRIKKNCTQKNIKKTGKK